VSNPDHLPDQADEKNEESKGAQESVDDKDEDFAAERAPGHNRRISRLDNVTKF